ncbi:integral membrane protein [Actinomyces sp. Chiba101]|uniref:EamA domain-containing membrane protein RarD n=1 Tax=Actinomyces denticolens TaxID=52767 RepID=A0ABY1IJN1_9ACTO|nr:MULTISPECIES: DMT family transporter [Actinomyces]BAW92136.1 integral membrane protein [Actinomyces sp. Chiba101]GAV94925.1 integral membrane protein [Actinomyces denticolens]SHJ26818.1 EamA domain-containing membrane protein RarD [Actinomyces denticolens]SUU11120.1 Predicted permeases [Actinomyces denticolens]
MNDTSTTPDLKAAGSTYVMDKRLGAIAMLISATGMGLVGTFSRGATNGLIPDDKAVIGSFLASGRMLTGLAGFTVLLLVTGRTALFRATRLSPAIIMGGISIGLSLGCYISSTLLTTIANAVFLIYTGPLFCTILARIFRKERISRLNGLFLLIVFVGMLMTIGIIDYKDGALSFGLDLSVTSTEYPKKALGDLLGLLSGLFYGMALFFNGYRKDVDSIVRGVWNFVWASVAALSMALVLRPWHGVSAFTGSNWGSAGLLFVFSGLVALGFLVVAGRNLPAVEMSTISYWECPVAIICGLLIFHEQLTPIGMIGGTLIVGGGFAPIIVDALARAGKRSVATA